MFRFTIRDVLWLTVVVALAVAWLVERNQFRRQIEELKKEVALREISAQYLSDSLARLGHNPSGKATITDGSGKEWTWQPAATANP
jgi:hypothetical protein